MQFYDPTLWTILIKDYYDRKKLKSYLVGRQAYISVLTSEVSIFKVVTGLWSNTFKAINFIQHISIYRSRSKIIVSLQKLGTCESQYHLDICSTWVTSSLFFPFKFRHTTFNKQMF